MQVSFVGVCSIDLYSKCDRLPNLGETIHGISLDRGFGGKAANSAAQFSFLAKPEQRPFLLTCVGKDSSGDEILQHFREAGVDTSLIHVTNNKPTGLAICFVLHGGESAIVIHPCPVTIDMVQAHRNELISSKYVVTNFEIDVEVAKEVLSISHSGGAKTILAATPIVPNLDLSILNNVSILVVNKIEKEALGPIESLFEHGVETVITTLGGNGAEICQRGKKPIAIPTPQVDVVDSTGAGDSFLGAFVYGLSIGKSMEESAKMACVVASISVQFIGTQSSYPHRGNQKLKSLNLE